MEDQLLGRIMAGICLLCGLACLRWPAFFVKTAKLRLRLLLKLFPEERHPSVIRFIGGFAVFAGLVGLLAIYPFWK